MNYICILFMKKFAPAVEQKESLENVLKSDPKQVSLIGRMITPSLTIEEIKASVAGVYEELNEVKAPTKKRYEKHLKGF